MMQRSQKRPRWLEDDGLIILLALALTVIYLPMFGYWLDGWFNKNIGIEHEYFSHAIIGFPYAAYVVWQQRRKWSKLPEQCHFSGLVLLVIGVIFYLTGVPDLAFLSFPLILTSICLCLKGIPGLKLQWFPLLLVFLGTPNPIPYLLTPFTLPLQRFITNVAGFILMQARLNVAVTDVYLEVNGQTVEVAPYCAGLKMLFTSLYVTLILLHMTDSLKSVKKTIFMLAAATFISVNANIIRNTLLALFHGLGNQTAFNSLHEGAAGDLYSALMLMCIVGINHWLDRVTAPPQPLTERSSHHE